MGALATLSRAQSGGLIKSNSGIPSQGFLPTLGSTPSAAGVLISQATAMTVSTVYACVTIRSEDVSRCTPRLFKVDKFGIRGDPVTDHPIAKLFVRPNRIQTWFEFCEQMEGALLLKSNAYAAILRDGRGRPTELIPINPDAAMVLEASDGQIFYNINRVGLFQMAALRDFPVCIPAEDILHLRGLAFNMLVGASKIGLARDSIGVSMGLEQQAARWMSNGARPSGVLSTDKTLSDTAATRLKSSWNSLFQGIQNVGAVAVLEEGLKWTALQLTSADLEFLNQRNFQVEDVARFYRVPMHKLAKTEGLRGLNLIQADQEYVNDAIMPDCERWEQKFEHHFDLADEGLEVDFDESNLLRADVTTRWNTYRIGVLSGITAPNEARRSEKLPPVDGGDEVRAPVNLAALGSDVTGTAPDDAGRPDAGTVPLDSVPTN